MPKSRWFKRRREEERRRKDRDQTKTVEEVFDSYTLAHLYKLERRGIIEELKGVVSSGKESRVYWGVSPEGRDLAVKIYLSATAEFRKSIKKYILGDPRFESIPKGNFRKLIYEWTRKEYRNLRRLHSSGVRVPEPIAFQGNILVMEFLGEKGYRAPLLIEILEDMTREELEEVTSDILDQLEIIVCKAGLVHGDLSPYNIMYWQNKIWIIDVSQAVPHTHPLAPELLQRDIHNITAFLEQYLGELPSQRRIEAITACLETRE